MKRLMHMFRRNDIIVRIYLSFVVVLALTVTLIGVIFLKLYENNYMRSYTETLSRHWYNSPSVAGMLCHY